LLAAATAHRADIRAAERDAASAKSAVKATWGGYLPKVQAYAGYDWSKSVQETSLDAKVHGWNVGLIASMTLFDGFNREAKVYAANAAKRRAEAAELQTRLNVSVEVRQAYSNFTQDKEILVASQQVVEQARESLRLAKARYSAGNGTQLDVLQAQSALSQARLTLLQAQYDYGVAVARLEKATGTHDWKIKIEDKKAAEIKPVKVETTQVKTDEVMTEEIKATTLK
jgi:outer membrane protein TolC